MTFIIIKQENRPADEPTNNSNYSTKVFKVVSKVTFKASSRAKQGSSWVAVTKVYCKANSAWIEIDPSTLDSIAKYVHA